MKVMKAFFKQFTPAVFIALVLMIVVSGVAWAATWEYRFPISVTDNTSTARTALPVMLGFGGTQLVNSNKIDSTGLATNLIGATAYMMSTDHVTAVIPSLPADAKAQLYLYTGYSPAQTGFSIITGQGGYVTIPGSPSLELGDNGSVNLTNTYFDTSSSANVVNKANVFVLSQGSGNLTFTDVNPYPVVGSYATSNGTLSSSSITCALPSNSGSGDLLIASVRVFGTSGTLTITPPSGWTSITDIEVSGYAYSKWDVFYKVIGSSEPDPATFSLSLSSGTYAINIVRIEGGTYQGVPVAGTAVSTSGLPDPPSLTSGFGTVKTLWLAMTGAVMQVTGAPTGYSGFVNAGGANAYGHASAAYAWLQAPAATENPGAFSAAGSSGYAANTFAVEGVPTRQLTASVATGFHDVSITDNTTDLIMNVDGTNVASVVSSVSLADSSDNWTFNAPVIGSLSISVNGTQQAYYAPNTMISGDTLPDRTGNGHDGTITWGSNTGLTVTYGEMSSSAAVNAVTSNVTTGFTMPDAFIPANWFASGANVTNLPFYDMVKNTSDSTGIPVQTLYLIVIYGLSLLFCLLLIITTRSAFVGVLAMVIVLFFGTSMSVIPFWIPFAILLVDFGIMYLYRQVTY